MSIPHKLPPMVMIFETRPELRNIVCMIIKCIESQDCLPEELVAESEETEKDLNMAADHLSDIVGMESPIQMFHKLLGRSLKHYKLKELMAMLGDAKEQMLLKEFEAVLYKICPEATFSSPALQKLAKHFEDHSKNADGYVDRDKLTKYVSESLSDYLTSGERGTSPHNAEPQMHSTRTAKDKFTMHAGEEDLKSYMADMDEEKMSGKLSRWAVLYCGGSVPVSEELFKVCKDFDIKYDQEKFDW